MIQQTTLDRFITWSGLLPPLLLLAAAYWLNQLVQPLPLGPDSSKRHDADFIVTQFIATTLSEQGAPRFKLTAAQMLHYPDDDSMHLEAPQFTSLSPNQPMLTATANKGTVSGKGDEVFLRENVKIVRAASLNDKQSEMIFSTSYLHIIPERDLADTDQPVTMTDGRNTINAIGMQLDSKARTVKLLAQVRSEHEPARKNEPQKK